MNIPGYDTWKLRGPEEERSVMMEACANCDGLGHVWNLGVLQDCADCEGMGEVEVTLDEPDSDYLYERARDARWESGK